ncbi:MAG: Tetratricopeptide repeat protein, partial [Verrucomicrobiales bacterium]|nr:Tetratricopeptide repeat protein [Verrucomicrobiales bacterium]
MSNESTAKNSRNITLVVFFGFLAAFLFTMNRWVNLSSVHVLAQSSGWEWRPLLVAPLLVLIEKTGALLPISNRVLYFNLLSVVSAALTLALLARSVVLLPNDRTKEQRSRLPEDGTEPLLIRWLPPLVATCVCGFQLTFWENATNF